MEFLIGDVIEWKVGKILSKGIVREDKGQVVDVVMFEHNYMPCKSKQEVQKELLKPQFFHDKMEGLIK